MKNDSKTGLFFAITRFRKTRSIVQWYCSSSNRFTIQRAWREIIYEQPPRQIDETKNSYKIDSVGCGTFTLSCHVLLPGLRRTLKHRLACLMTNCSTNWLYSVTDTKINRCRKTCNGFKTASTLINFSCLTALKPKESFPFILQFN